MAIGDVKILCKLKAGLTLSQIESKRGIKYYVGLMLHFCNQKQDGNPVANANNLIASTKYVLVCTNLKSAQCRAESKCRIDFGSCIHI